MSKNLVNYRSEGCLWAVRPAGQHYSYEMMRQLDSSSCRRDLTNRSRADDQGPGTILLRRG
jgi:hypothetical protein